MVKVRTFTLSNLMLVLFIDLVMTAGGIAFLAYNNYAIRETINQNNDIIHLVISNQALIRHNQETIKSVQNYTLDVLKDLHSHSEQEDQILALLKNHSSSSLAHDQADRT